MVELYPSGVQGMLFNNLSTMKMIISDIWWNDCNRSGSMPKKLFEKGLLRSGIMSPTRIPGMLFKYLNFHENGFFKVDI